MGKQVGRNNMYSSLRLDRDKRTNKCEGGFILMEKRENVSARTGPKKKWGDGPRKKRTLPIGDLISSRKKNATCREKLKKHRTLGGISQFFFGGRRRQRIRRKQAGAGSSGVLTCLGVSLKETQA